jgi:hypothetical protein
LNRDREKNRLVDPARAVGLDISGAAVCRANVLLARGDRLTYVEGDAERCRSRTASPTVITSRDA